MNRRRTVALSIFLAIQSNRLGSGVGVASFNIKEKGMKRLVITLLMLISAVGNALAQNASLKEQVVGTWIHVSTTVTAPDGKKSDRPGQGVLIYAPDGYFAFVNVANTIPQ